MHDRDESPVTAGMFAGLTLPQRAERPGLADSAGDFGYAT
jgi:hypothetical protein